MYTPNELKESTQGIYKKFPKFPNYVKSLKNTRMDYSEDIARLENYANGVTFKFSNMDEIQCKNLGLPYTPQLYTYLDMTSDLHRYSIKRLIDSHIACFEKDAHWEDIFKEAVACRYWVLRMEINFHQLAYQEFTAGIRQQKLAMLNFRDAGVTIGFCMSLGWLDYAIDLRDRTNTAIEQEFFYDAYDDACRRRTQHFVMRLLNSYEGKQDVQEKKTIRCAYDVDLFNDLISKWKTNDLVELSDLITKACDRHTHQCRQDSWNDNRFYDFPNVPLESHYPFEILSIFKLRETLKLDVPPIDHLLLKSPLATSMETSEPLENKFLNALLARARRETEVLNEDDSHIFI